MELGKTENSEIIFIHTDDLEVAIKGGTSGETPPFVAPDQLESNVTITCASAFLPSVRGRAEIISEGTFAGKFTANVSCDPLFFEQTSYTLIAEANEGHTLEFDHENVNLRKSITRFGRKDLVLSGILNFRNEIGMSDLIFKLDGQEYLRITIEVFPSKISYKKDYQEILADVTAEVYNLAFDAFRRTYDSYSLSGKTGNSPIEFFTIIRKIYRDFTIAADMIIARPHHVLQSDYVVLPQHKVRRADNATLRWIEKHPEHVVRRGDAFAVDRALAVRKHVIYDTRENRLAKYMLMQTARRLEIFRKQFMNVGRSRDEKLDAEIDRMIRGIRRRYAGNFLSRIEAEPSKAGMSLVFSMAPGYRDLFKYYLMLQRGLSVTGSVFHVSTKDMALLYEYWCFIKLNSMLRESGYTLESQDFVKVSRNEIAVTLVKGKSSRIRYITDKGERIELFYNPSYGRKNDQSNSGRSEAATTPQKPDNVLSLTKRGPSRKSGGSTENVHQYKYVFDAKYRIGADADYMQRHNGLEGSKEEDINTMHRYRDAIVYDMNRNVSASNGAGQNMSGAGAGTGAGTGVGAGSGAVASARERIPGPYDRTMFGAYVLFPYSDEEKYKEHDFYKSIKTVNIGGLPFLPSATNMVRDFLEELISDTAESAFERATLPRGIEEKLARVDWKKRNVLIVNVPDDIAMASCRDSSSLAVACDDISREHLSLHYVALYQPGVGIDLVGTVLFTKMDGAGNYVFQVDEWRQLPQRIAASEFGVASVAYTNMFLLENSTAYPELHLRSEAEYRFYSELKRRVKEVDYKSDEVSGFEFEGKKIVFEGGEIRLMDGKKNPVSIRVREFERRPNAEFRRVMGYVGKVRG